MNYFQQRWNEERKINEKQFSSYRVSVWCTMVNPFMRCVDVTKNNHMSAITSDKNNHMSTIRYVTKNNHMSTITSDKNNHMSTITSNKNNHMSTMTSNKNNHMSTITSNKNNHMSTITSDKNNHMSTITSNRQHDRQLIPKMSKIFDNNFIVRMLYTKMYIDFVAIAIISDFPCTVFLYLYVHDAFCHRVFKRIWMNEWFY